jgi:O-succinylbenzoic acid--CoA ligase
MWTSGTTGAPRAIVHGGGGVVRVAGHQLRHMGMRVGDHLPLTLPLSTVGGIMALLRSALGRGVVIPLARFDEAEVVRLMHAGRAQHLSLVPVMLRRVLDRLDRGDPLPDDARLRTVLVGGAPCPAPLVERALAAGLPVALTWGMTESCAQAVTATPAQTRRDSTSVGRPLEHVRLRVDDTGRLALRLEGLEPAELVRDGGGEPRLRPLVDDDGWLVTSDLGEVSADGTLRITGRVSDRIISGGVNVDPVEVERHLERHPGVAEVAVVGTPDTRWGERVTAVVVPRQVEGGTGERLRTSALREALEAHARSGLAPAKRPRSWVWTPALPRSAAGKIDRDALRRLAASAEDG